MNRRDFLLALGVGAGVIGANALRVKASKSTETPKVTKEGTDDSKEPTKPTT